MTLLCVEGWDLVCNKNEQKNSWIIGWVGWADWVDIVYWDHVWVEMWRGDRSGRVLWRYASVQLSIATMYKPHQQKGGQEFGVISTIGLIWLAVGTCYYLSQTVLILDYMLSSPKIVSEQIIPKHFQISAHFFLKSCWRSLLIRRLLEVFTLLICEYTALWEDTLTSAFTFY